MKSYLEDMEVTKNRVRRGGHETVGLRNRALELIPVAMYNI